jgi:hypothetical protein
LIYGVWNFHPSRSLLLFLFFSIASLPLALNSPCGVWHSSEVSFFSLSPPPPPSEINFLKDGGDEEASLSGMDEEEDIAGFRLSVIKQRKPHLAQQLDDFGTFLMRQDVKVDELNVWDFKGKLFLKERKLSQEGEIIGWGTNNFARQ